MSKQEDVPNQESEPLKKLPPLFYRKNGIIYKYNPNNDEKQIIAAPENGDIMLRGFYIPEDYELLEFPQTVSRK